VSALHTARDGGGEVVLSCSSMKRLTYRLIRTVPAQVRRGWGFSGSVWKSLAQKGWGVD
jgi:hypothetical protein